MLAQLAAAESRHRRVRLKMFLNWVRQKSAGSLCRLKKYGNHAKEKLASEEGTITKNTWRNEPAATTKIPYM